MNNISSVSYNKDKIFVVFANDKTLEIENESQRIVHFDVDGDITGNIFAVGKNYFLSTISNNVSYSVLKISEDHSNSFIGNGTLIKVNNNLLIISELVDNKYFKASILDSSSILKWSVQEDDFWVKLFSSSNIYCSNKNIENRIIKYACDDGNKVWEINNTNRYNTINDNPNFVTAIEGWVLNKTELIVPLRNGKILVIDDGIGNVKKVLFSDNPNGQWGEYYHDTSRNKLVKFINKTIHEVDLDTHEIEFFEPARFKDKDAEPNGGKWAQDETYIYYCSFDGTTVNALNKKTKEIDWQHQHKQNADDLDIVNEVPVRYQNVQYHQGRLFVMDNKRSLHIFEEEDMPHISITA